LSRIELTSPFLSGVLRVKSSAEADPIVFRSGETLNGRIVEAIDDRHAVIRLGGYDLPVESQVPLSKDMEGYFRVEATHPQVILKFIPAGETADLQVDTLLKKYLPFDFSPESLFGKLATLWEMKAGTIPFRMQDTVDRLSALLQGFSIRQPFTIDPEHLREIVSRGGLFFERKLRDLVETQTEDQYDQRVKEDMKGLLLELKAQLKSLASLGSDPDRVLPGSKDMLSSVDQLLQKIEAYQVLNLSPSTHPEKIFLLLPLWFHDNLQLVEMNLSLPRPDGDRSSSDEHSILFLLDLPEWGRVSIGVKIRGKGLYCRFTVSDPDLSAFLIEAFPELSAQLNRIGFQPHLDVSVESPEKMVQAWVSEIGERGKSWLNIVI
jgi:hypothetical protein